MDNNNSILVDKIDTDRVKSAHNQQGKPSNQFVYHCIRCALEENRVMASINDITIEEVRLARDSEYNHVNAKEIAKGVVKVSYTDIRGDEFNDDINYGIYVGRNSEGLVYDNVEVTLN